jgi:mono/diheme cytochrome c family protein
MGMNNRKSIATLLTLTLLLLGFSARADNLALSGSELFGQFCASCHGTIARGDGPAAKSLQTEVPDLTLIASRQGGKFPADHVERIIDGRFIIGAHGTREMPIWGDGLSRSELGNPDAERATRTIIARLVEYLRSIQRSAKTFN